MTEIDRAELRNLAAAYALAALEPEEARQFEALLETSPQLQREVAEYREISALLALEAPAAVPDASTWKRLQERIGEAQSGVLRFRKPRARIPTRSTLAWAAAAAGILVAGALTLRMRDLSQELATRTDELERATTDLSTRQQLIDQVLGVNTVVFTLVSTAAPEPSVRVFWNRETNIWLLHATNLAPAPPARVYQLWFIRGGNPIPSVTFNSGPDGQAVVTAAGPSAIAGLTHAAVTEEPEGGSEQPTSEPILVGTVTTD